MKPSLLILILAIVQQIGFTVSYIPQLYQLAKREYVVGISVTYYFIRILSLMVLSTAYIIGHDWALFWTNNISIIIEVIILILTIIKTNEFMYNWDGKPLDR